QLGMAVLYFDEAYVYQTVWKQDDIALEAYNQALMVDPKWSAAYMAYNNRGTVYYHQQQYEMALADFSEVLDLKPNYAAAYNNRGLVYVAQQQDDLALADYTKAIALNPNLAEVYNNRGIIYDDQQKYDQALADYTQAITLSPNYAEAYNN